MNKIGKLYVCPTPIGNLKDITFRVIETLKEVDLIAAEDTRHTLKLLNHFEIKKPLTSYHRHSSEGKLFSIVEKLEEGENIALVSDAGMPGISDPGEDLIKLAIERGIDVEVLPGATASITALVASGLPTNKFVFEGFLSQKKKDRRRSLEELKNETRTLILYESPHRIKEFLKDVLSIMGDRNISLSREITKKHEETIRGKVSEVVGLFEEEAPRGEFVIVLEGIDPSDIEQQEEVEEITIKESLIKYIEEGLSKKDAVKKVSKERKTPKNEVYKESLDI